MRAPRYSPIEMIERLVAFDTTSAKSNLPLIAFVEDYLAAHGVASRRSGAADKANLLATVGPQRPGGIVLSGHSDVVPVTGQDWTSDPFRLSRRGSRLYGRGSADMKSFIAIALALVPEFLATELTLPLHLAISYDEEVGCLGVGSLIAMLTRELPRPGAVIIGEPTSMQLVTTHKGVCVFETKVRGRAAHSSQPQRGANAVAAAGEIIAFIAALAAEKRKAAPLGGASEPPFEPPYTTFNIGRISGGTAINIIAAECSFLWEFRALPHDDPAGIEAVIRRHVAQEVAPALREHAPEAAIETRLLANVPALHPEAGGPAEALVRRLTGSNQSTGVSFGTEGGMFQEAGLSTVVCGPGSIDQAHRADEFIEIAQVEACVAFLRELACWCSRPSDLPGEG